MLAPAHCADRLRGFLVSFHLSASLAACGVDERSFTPSVEGPDPSSSEDGGKATTPAPDSGNAAGGTAAEPPEPPDEAPLGCDAPVDCARAACDGASCGESGRRCEGGVCACPRGVASEAVCGDALDDDCDGAADCADSDCEGVQCGASAAARCCSGECVDTTTDRDHCQGCGLACAAGQECVLISDESGVRGHCTCFASDECPGFPSTICRKENGDGQDDLCACDYVSALNRGCAGGQVCADVPRANFCRYP